MHNPVNNVEFIGHFIIGAMVVVRKVVTILLKVATTVEKATATVGKVVGGYLGGVMGAVVGSKTVGKIGLGLWGAGTATVNYVATTPMSMGF